MSSYKRYFRNHFGATFTNEDINRYQDWFYPQWKIISSKLEIPSDAETLEIGSGLGGLYSLLKEKKGYVGLELDKEAVNFSKTHFKSGDFKNSSLEKFKTNRKFDVIFAFEVLEHLADPKSALAKIHRLLKDGGVFCGTSPYPFYKNVISDRTHLYVLHPENWKMLFKEVGFSSIETAPLSFFPSIWKMHKKLNIRIPFFVPFRGFISTSLIIANK